MPTKHGKELAPARRSPKGRITPASIGAMLPSPGTEGNASGPKAGHKWYISVWIVPAAGIVGVAAAGAAFGPLAAATVAAVLIAAVVALVSAEESTGPRSRHRAQAAS